MKKKVVHIIYSGLGGHFDYVMNLESCRSNLAHIHLICLGVETIPESYLSVLRSNQISFEYLPVKFPRFTVGLKIIQRLRALQPEVIYVHSNAAITPVATYSKRNTVITINVEHHNNQLKSRRDLRRSIVASVHFNQTVYLTPEHKKEASINLGRYFDEQKTSVIRTGLLETSFVSNAETAKAKYIGMQSRLVPIKDHETLIRAFHQIAWQEPDWKLSLAGDGVERQKLEALSRELKLENRIEFTGMLNKSALQTWLSKLTIYVHATLGETSSIALMEAMAAKLPVIASDVSGISNFLNPEIALLVPPTNVEELSNALIRLINNAQERDQLAEKALNFALAHCRISETARQYDALEMRLKKQA